MDEEYLLSYSLPLVRRAVNRFWRRAVGWKFGVAVAFVLISLVLALRRGDRSWFVGVLGFAAFLGILFPIAVYAMQYRRAVGAFRKLADCKAVLTIKDDGFRLESVVGYSELSWQAIAEVWRYQDMWLLIFSKAFFVTIPMLAIDESGRRRIEQRVGAAGGKLV